MFDSWDMIKKNFELIWSTMMAHKEKTKNDQSGICAQLQESINYLNDIGQKLDCSVPRLVETQKRKQMVILCCENL
jgi:hypothetical protein